MSVERSRAVAQLIVQRTLIRPPLLWLLVPVVVIAKEAARSEKGGRKGGVKFLFRNTDKYRPASIHALWLSSLKDFVLLPHKHTRRPIRTTSLLLVPVSHDVSSLLAQHFRARREFLDDAGRGFDELKVSFQEHEIRRARVVDQIVHTAAM